MSKQDRQDWLICFIAGIAAIVTIVLNIYLHGGRIAW
jgi:hypothetical protein